MDMKLFHEISNYKCHQFKTNILIYSHTTEKTIRFVWGGGGEGGGLHQTLGQLRSKFLQVYFTSLSSLTLHRK